jgi:hypothetical protein
MIDWNNVKLSIAGWLCVLLTYGFSLFPFASLCLNITFFILSFGSITSWGIKKGWLKF